MVETLETNQPQLDKPTEINPKNPTEASEMAPELTPNLCQGYKVDPLTKLHLCQTCPYHCHRNKTKPWLRKGEG